MDEFISEDDLLTFEGWLKYQAVDPAEMTPEQLTEWKRLFDEMIERLKTSPKVGLMNFFPIAGQQKYGVAIRDRDGTRLWLTMWVKCSPKGDIYILYPRGDRTINAHASYHVDGRLHQKSYGFKTPPMQRQRLDGVFKGSEHLGRYLGHGTVTGAVCEPKAFDSVLIVEPGIFGPNRGAVGVDVVEPGYEPEWERDIAPTYYFGEVYRRERFPRDRRPSVVITIER